MNAEEIAVTVQAVIEAMKTHKFVYTTEKDLQAGIAEVLGQKGILFEREVKIGDKEVIDFMIGGTIGLEVKTKGSPSDVARQLLAYAGRECVKELILVTGRARLGRLPEMLLGKRIHVVTLWQNFL